VKLVRLEIENFTAFEHAVFDFSSGVNVLIGENGTGKSHVLKLGGEVVNEQGRFYLRVPGGKIEAPLVAEGIRKLAMLDYLIANGSLSENGFLLWDEPEASLNPKLTRLTSQVAMGLARSGIQTWIATHDYLLTSELDLAVEQSPEDATAFFALTRASNSAPTTIERGDKLADLEHNSILDAFSDLHRREERAFIGEEVLRAEWLRQAYNITAESLPGAGPARRR
jgi:predicted ATPase